MTDQPMAREVCDHSWAWVHPAGARTSARICMSCHEPSAEWLNKLWEQISEHNEGEIMCGCQSEHPGCICGGLSCDCHRPRRSSRDYIRNSDPFPDEVYVSISFPKVERARISRIISAATHAAGTTTSFNVFIDDVTVDHED